jgi:hypothetical protein
MIVREFSDAMLLYLVFVLEELGCCHYLTSYVGKVDIATRRGLGWLQGCVGKYEGHRGDNGY